MATHISFAPNRELPFVFGDLFQVSSKLSHYRLGGIQQISSVISGQYAENKQIHEETTQTEYYEEQESLSEKESSHLESTHEGMQRALTETVASSQKISASAEAEATYGVIRAAVSLGYDNDKSKSQSKTDATDFAHDVVDQSRELVRERVLSSRRSSTTVLDRTENVRGFDNRGGASSAFITRYVEEVHRFSLVQHEKHLFTRFFLPFPAANYLNAIDAGLTNPKIGQDDPARLTYMNPATKKTVTIGPDSVSTDPNSASYWFKLASIFGLTDPTPPPGEMGEAHALTFDRGEVNADEYAAKSATVKVPEGYRCKGLFVRAWAEAWHTGASTDRERFFVGLLAGHHNAVAKGWGEQNWLRDNELDLSFDEELASGELPFVFYARGFFYGVFSLYFRFLPTVTHINQWKLQFFQELRNAQSGKAQGPDMMAAAGAGVQVADLRSSPTAAEKVIKQELRREAVRFVTGTDLTGLDPVNRKAKPFPYYPWIDVAKANELQPIYDFLSTGFDFDKMSFTFLPNWLGAVDERLNAYAGGSTGMMTEFLNAGAAEIILPVRSGREEQLFFFLKTGIIFDGSDVPLPDDPITLALYDEILEARELNQSPKSIAIQSWDEYLPTPHVMLQAGATMPDFRPNAPPDPGGVAGNMLAPQAP